MRVVLSADGAAAILAAGERYAHAHDLGVTIAVVDAAGELLRLGQTEGAHRASSRVAVDKARTAARFARPTRSLEDEIGGGRLGALSPRGAAALTGALPLLVDGGVVGAVGTSGETADDDEAVSRAAAAADRFATLCRPRLSRACARLAVEAVAATATARGIACVVATVDADGELLELWRADAAAVASIAVAIDTARTAALYRRPSRDFEELAASTRPSVLHLARALPLQGGVPIVLDGHVCGAMGVNGAPSTADDHALAAHGATLAST